MDLGVCVFTKLGKLSLLTKPSLNAAKTRFYVLYDTGVNIYQNLSIMPSPKVFDKITPLNSLALGRLILARSIRP